MKPGPAISVPASHPSGSRTWRRMISASARGGRPASRARTIATFEARSPKAGALGTSIAQTRAREHERHVRGGVAEGGVARDLYREDGRAPEPQLTRGDGPLERVSEQPL